jgi:hypothetical protein
LCQGIAIQMTDPAINASTDANRIGCHNVIMLISTSFFVKATYSRMIRALPLIIGLAPIFGVTAAYWLNVDAGVLPACMPLLDGCTSISSAGRTMPGTMPFRAVLLPQAALLAMLWWISTRWLKQVSPASRSPRAIMICGLAGSIALILYVTFLGTQQPFYEFMKHFGIYFYFLGTALSQVFFTWSMPRSKLRNLMLFVIGTPFVLGLLNLLQKAVLAHPNNIENRIEWTAALLMQVWFVCLYFAWRRSGIALIVRTDSTSDHH